MRSEVGNSRSSSPTKDGFQDVPSFRVHVCQGVLKASRNCACEMQLPPRPSLASRPGRTSMIPCRCSTSSGNLRNNRRAPCSSEGFIGLPPPPPSHPPAVHRALSHTYSELTRHCWHQPADRPPLCQRSDTGACNLKKHVCARATMQGN